MSERTLAIIKPDAVKKLAIGDILGRYEKAGLKPVAMKLLHMAKPVESAELVAVVQNLASLRGTEN